MPPHGGSKGTLGALQKVWVRVYRQVARPSTLTSCREWRREDNLGYDYLYEQESEAQSAKYYYSTERHTGVDTDRHSCASGLKDPYY